MNEIVISRSRNKIRHRVQNRWIWAIGTFNLETQIFSTMLLKIGGPQLMNKVFFRSNETTVSVILVSSTKPTYPFQLDVTCRSTEK